jgi:hypothetical protein
LIAAIVTTPPAAPMAKHKMPTVTITGTFAVARDISPSFEWHETTLRNEEQAALRLYRPRTSFIV